MWCLCLTLIYKYATSHTFLKHEKWKEIHEPTFDVMERDLARARVRLGHAISSYKRPVVLVLFVRPQCRITKQSSLRRLSERQFYSALHLPPAQLLVHWPNHNREDGLRLAFSSFEEVSVLFSHHPSDFCLISILAQVSSLAHDRLGQPARTVNRVSYVRALTSFTFAQNGGNFTCIVTTKGGRLRM